MQNFIVVLIEHGMAKFDEVHVFSECVNLVTSERGLNKHVEVELIISLNWKIGAQDIGHQV